MTDPAAARDKERAAAREREALRQRAEDADGWQRRAEHAEAELAALAAARLALEQDLEGVQTELDQVCRVERQAQAAFNIALKRADAAEAAVTALRQELQALPRHRPEQCPKCGALYLIAHGIDRRCEGCGWEGEERDLEAWIRARDLADRLAKDHE